MPQQLEDFVQEDGQGRDAHPMGDAQHGSDFEHGVAASKEAQWVISAFFNFTSNSLTDARPWICPLDRGQMVSCSRAAVSSIRQTSPYDGVFLPCKQTKNYDLLRIVHY